jgi:SAM-dependent methyltransferase
MPDFSDVDSAPRPLALVGMLDAVRQLPAVAVYKAQALQLLRLERGQRVLDAGCGAGDDAACVAEIIGPYGLCVGADLSATMVAEARDRHPSLRLEFMRADCRRLPYLDASFHSCRIDRVLHAIDDPQGALAEAVRVVRPGGRVVVSEPDWSTLKLAPDDDALTRLLLELVHARGPGARMGGGDLATRLSGLGVADVQVVSFTGVVTDFAVARRVSGLDDLLGIVEAETAARWLDAMQAASRAGAFRAELGGVTAAGTVPARQAMAASS